MHTEETKLQFIELRAQEKTLDEISRELNVCKRTLVHWNREFADDIADLREVEREALRRKLFGTAQDWMKDELAHYARLDAEFAGRQFKYSPTESVFRMRAECRKRIEKFLFAESPLDVPRPRRSPAVPHPLTNNLPAPQTAATPEAPPRQTGSPAAQLPECHSPPGEDDFVGSVVVNPDDSAASIMLKCCQAERT